MSVVEAVLFTVVLNHESCREPHLEFYSPVQELMDHVVVGAALLTDCIGEILMDKDARAILLYIYPFRRRC